MRESKGILIVLMSLFLLVAISGTGIGADVTLAWSDPNPPGANVQGYTLYWGSVNPPVTAIDVGKVLTGVVPALTVGDTYYFAVDAYNSAGHSAKSDILEYTIPEQSTTIKIPNRPGMTMTITVNYD